ncbi:MAG: hypothetical protein QM690_15645 [Sphingobium sp.]
MIHSSITQPGRGSGVFAEGMVVAAARCWREARDSGRPIQPALHAMLAPTGHDLLGPVFDSVMRLCESRLNRAICTGCPLAAPSDDEHMICALLTDPGLLSRLGRCRADEAEMDVSLDCALRSARIMLAMLQPH